MEDADSLLQRCHLEEVLLMLQLTARQQQEASAHLLNHCRKIRFMETAYLGHPYPIFVSGIGIDHRWFWQTAFYRLIYFSEIYESGKFLVAALVIKMQL